MANLQLPLNQDHEVLGSEYCSGYMDALERWNPGFYCPASDESRDVFCCGTESHKYCCTRKDQVIQSEVQDLTVLIGVLVGASAAILIITLVSCFCCSCCFLYKKRNPNAATMYRLNAASEHSGVTNMYSLSNLASRSGTPVQAQTAAMMHHHGSHGQLLEVGNEILVGGGSSHSHRIPVQMDEADQMRMTMTQGRQNGTPTFPSLSHSHTLPHSLSHHHNRYHASPNVRNNQATPVRQYPRHHQTTHYNTVSRLTSSGHQRVQRPCGRVDPTASSYVRTLDISQHAPNGADVFIAGNEAAADAKVVNSLGQAEGDGSATAAFPLSSPIGQLQHDQQLFHSTKF